MSGRPEKEDDSTSSGMGKAAGLAALVVGAIGAGVWLYKKFSNKPVPDQSMILTTNTPAKSVSSVASSGFNVDEEVVTRDVNRLLTRSNIGNHPPPQTSSSPGPQTSCKCKGALEKWILEPCNHSLCENCAVKIDDVCPICTNKIDNITLIVHSSLAERN